MTNAEVDARMFISRGTVKVHLSHIFAKLEVGTHTLAPALRLRRTRGGWLREPPMRGKRESAVR
jgi:DNA-binding NarL/FixJ family response regulator